MISVVLMTYNQSIKDILFSINSVILQIGCDLELIIADDCSRDNQETVISNYLEDRGFSRFKFLRADVNKGIVANLLSGVEASSGSIIKPLSPGDALFSNDALAKIENFCACNQVQIGFGRLMGYAREGSEIKRFPYEAPTNPNMYNDENIELKRLLNNQIVGTDWIPGCSLFYRREFILHYLRKLQGAFGVKYSEDLTVPLITIDGIRPRYFDEYILWYEVGTGISTKGNYSSIQRLYADHHRFFDRLVSLWPRDSMYIMARMLFKIREFIALHTPFYRFAQSVVRSRYSNAMACERSLSEIDVSFFNKCLDYASIFISN